MAISGLKNLCMPSYIYLVVSLIALIVMAIQNTGNVNIFCLGSYSCNVSSVGLIFVIKLIYILFWTWILNLMCRAGAEGLSWLFIILPFLFFFGILFFT
jgi:hypothetical protein